VNEPRWLTIQQILAIHDRLISDHGGLAGVRDAGLLESALMRPRNTFAYESSSLFDLAAAYAHGIAKNHPFHDGNKRAALMSAYIFLGRNGYRLNATEEKAVIAVQMLASGELDQAGFAAWLKRESIPR
jgi:death-on-curing protein